MRIKPANSKAATSNRVDSAPTAEPEVDETSLRSVISNMPPGEGLLTDDQLICAIRNLVDVYHRFAAEPALHTKPVDVRAAIQDLKDCQEILLEKLNNLDRKSLILLIEAAGPKDPGDSPVWGLPALGHGLQRIEKLMDEIGRLGTWIETAQDNTPSAHPGKETDDDLEWLAIQLGVLYVRRTGRPFDRTTKGDATPADFVGAVLGTYLPEIRKARSPASLVRKTAPEVTLEAAKPPRGEIAPDPYA